MRIKSGSEEAPFALKSLASISERRNQSRQVSRRAVLQGLGALTASSAFAGSPLAETSDPLFASAFKMQDGRYGIALLDDFGMILGQILLPGRGHGFASSAHQGKLVAFARRPGNFAVLLNKQDFTRIETIIAPEGRHFYGHGCFSFDGHLLFATENETSSGNGLIGVYDTSGERAERIGAFPSHGIGPHEILLSEDGTSLIVANGGIRTHPDTGREKLNLESMSPSIAFIDPLTGDLQELQRLDKNLHKLSLRHMALDRSGKVWVGGQYEGNEEDTPPLVARFSRGTEARLFDLPAKLGTGLQNYIGSVSTNLSGDVVATSAPRGGKTLFWQSSTGACLGAKPIPDGCGVAPIDQHSFLISDGNGAISYVGDQSEPAEVLYRHAQYQWDNHLVRIA